MKGSTECKTPKELADRAAAEKLAEQQRIEAQKKQEEEARQEALRKKQEEAQRAAAERQAQQEKAALQARLKQLSGVQKKEDEEAAVWLKQKQIEQSKVATNTAAKKMQADLAQHIRDLNEKDITVAKQKTIAELTYKAQVVSITEQELGVGAIKAAFLAVPIAGEYAGAVGIGAKTTLTYLAGKQVTQSLLESGLDKILETKGGIPSDSSQNVVVRLISPALPYPLQVILKHEDLVLEKPAP